MSQFRAVCSHATSFQSLWQWAPSRWTRPTASPDKVQKSPSGLLHCPSWNFPHRKVFSLVPAATSQPTPYPSTEIYKRALKLLWQSWSGLAVSLSVSGSGSSLGWHSLLSLNCLTHCVVDPGRSNTICIYWGHQYTFYICYKIQFSLAFFFYLYIVRERTHLLQTGLQKIEKSYIIFPILYYFTKNPKCKMSGVLVWHLLLGLYQMSRLILMRFFSTTLCCW